MKKKFIKLWALLLALLMLCGCAETGAFALRGKTGGEAWAFDSIAYMRPDMADMEKAVAELEQSLKAPELPRDIRERLEHCYSAYNNFYTMYNLADIRSCQNTADEYYAAEIAWCMEQEPLMQQLMDRMYRLCAGSAHARQLEKRYFWEGFTEQFGAEESALPEALYALMQEEKRLITEYRAALAEPYIELDGQRLNYEDYISEADAEDCFRAMQTFYEQHNGPLAELYIELVKLRRQQAELLGYDSYEEMEYAMYERDYSPEQAELYLESIEKHMAPYYMELTDRGVMEAVNWKSLSSERLRHIMAQAAESMGGEIEKSFEYMLGHRLYDIESRPYKAAVSFQSYLEDYASPFIFLDAQGDELDVLSFAHEFGHFADAYINENAYETTDVAECFSQAMEYLSLFYLGDAMDQEEKQRLMDYKALDALETYVSQAALARFESRAYAMPEEELNAESLNQLYMDVNRAYGLWEDWDPLQGQDWISVSHLFEYPFYVISYPVTADVAGQILAMEQTQPGAGLKKMKSMLRREQWSFMPLLEDAGLESPFAPGSVERALAGIKALLD